MFHLRMKTLAVLALTLITISAAIRAQSVYDDLYYGDELTQGSSGDVDPVEYLEVEGEAPAPFTDDDDASEAYSAAVVSAPSLQDICSPSSESAKAFAKKKTKQRIKVIFVVILPGSANVTSSAGFDEARLISAMQKAGQAMGAQHAFEIKVSSIEFLGTQANKRRALLQAAIIQSIKVTGEADFAGEDEMVASEIVQLLTDTPSTIFPEADFGEVQALEATMSEIQELGWVLPVAGAVGGIICIGAVLSLYFWLDRQKRCPQDVGDPHEGFIPSSDYKLRTMSQTNLLPSISSKNYSDVAPVRGREREFNNLGYF
jgi:hypothetical protein